MYKNVVVEGTMVQWVGLIKQEGKQFIKTVNMYTIDNGVDIR